MARGVSEQPSSRRTAIATTGSSSLSDAQLESVIYAGEAHADFLAGSWTVDETFDLVTAARDDAENAVRFRRGWFLGDGTGAGKGRLQQGIALPGPDARESRNEFRLTLPAGLPTYWQVKQAAFAQAFGRFSRVWSAR